jgi:5-methylcytosine-specific restriction protein A
MMTYLLTWKPDEWEYKKLQEYIESFNAGHTKQRWSCGTSKSILVGSRVFLMSQGKGKVGIFGSGKVVEAPFEADHYSDAKKTALYIMVEFDKLYDPSTQIKIDREEVKRLDDKLSKAQGSGKIINDELAVQIEKLWAERVGFTSIPYPDEGESAGCAEGAKKVISVNAYERNPEDWMKCIEKKGLNCIVCGFHFGLIYGELGRRYIHVHHNKPVAEIGKEYVVDPINDLTPVCPNCHAMLHRHKPALSIEELKRIVNTYRN